MKFAQIAQLVFIALAAVFVYSFVAAARDGETRRVCTPLCAMRPNYANVNRLVPDFELERMDGGKVRFSSYRGKTVILNFWTKTCRPCLEEMPSLSDLGKALKSRPNIVLVTITTDESAADARDTLNSVLGSDVPFEVLIDPEGEVVTGKFGTKLFPETWFIDKNGVIRARFDGGRDWSGAMTVDFAESLESPLRCQINFEDRKPEGPWASLCAQDAAE